MSVTNDPNDPGLRKIKADGQQETYLVLSDSERAAGFVRPLRLYYKHVGIPGPKFPLRDLTDEEAARYPTMGYVKYEAYADTDSSVVGKFWTQADLDKVGKGCQSITMMGRSIAETYARKPDFYSGTFCCTCGSHFPVGKHGEFVWEGTDERVGT